MPDYTVLIRVHVRDADSPKAAAQAVNCYLFDHFALQTALVQNGAGVTVGEFLFADLDRELGADREEGSAPDSF